MTTTVSLMPLQLRRARIDRASFMPVFRQVAEIVRSAVRAGELTPGEDLPSEETIAAALGVGRDSVREALALLANEGMVIKARGRPTRIAPQLPVRRIATSRYGDELRRVLTGAEGPPTGFSADHRISWDEYTVTTSYREEPASSAAAELLSVHAGTPVLRRYFVEFARDEPRQTRVSVMPLDLVADTPVADEKRQPWPGGTIAELHSLGKIVTTVSEDWRTRMPDPDEQRTLDLATGHPVWECVRVFEADGAPVECSEVILPGASHIVRVVTDLHPGEL